MKNIITFTTAPYSNSHSCEPRGCGVWAFEADFGETSMMIYTPYSMTHAKAKAFAIAEARKVAQAAGYNGSIELATQP
jgi:hypothetical protein